jgi:hypothetical protein
MKHRMKSLGKMDDIFSEIITKRAKGKMKPKEDCEESAEHEKSETSKEEKDEDKEKMKKK